jgi:hypothetical protein
LPSGVHFVFAIMKIFSCHTEKMLQKFSNPLNTLITIMCTQVDEKCQKFNVIKWKWKNSVWYLFIIIHSISSSSTRCTYIADPRLS